MDEKCDIWSIGVILYILLSGIPPFNGNTDGEIMAKVQLGGFDFEDPIWNEVSLQVKELIGKMLNMDPATRPSASEILEHPWFEIAPEQEVDQTIVKGAFENLKNFSAE